MVPRNPRPGLLRFDQTGRSAYPLDESGREHSRYLSPPWGGSESRTFASTGTVWTTAAGARWHPRLREARSKATLSRGLSPEQSSPGHGARPRPGTPLQVAGLIATARDRTVADETELPPAPTAPEVLVRAKADSGRVAHRDVPSGARDFGSAGWWRRSSTACSRRSSNKKPRDLRGFLRSG